MAMSREALTEVAAIVAASPQVTLRLETLDGATVVVGDHGTGALCIDGFRRLMAAWVDGCEPHVARVDFPGARYHAGMLAVPGLRYFVTHLSAEHTARCLRERTRWPDEAHAIVREDLLLDISVVQVMSSELDEDALEDAAREAQAACVVEELCREVEAA